MLFSKFSMVTVRRLGLVGACLVLLLASINDVRAHERFKEGYADSSGVKIHYVTAGSGPLVIMIHGFPDYWYTWRDQIPALSKNFQVVAMDQRGYNKSDQPKGVDNYSMRKLVDDVAAVADHFKAKKAIIIGHDWGGAVAWNFAMRYPDRIDRLVVLNLPHPRGLARELANNPQQQKNSQYARNFQKADAASKLTPKGLAGWVTEDEARKKYVEAFRRSSIEGMLNFYKANYPKSVSKKSADPKNPNRKNPSMPQVKCPVLMFHGLNDRALLPAGLNNTWNWIDNDLTIITIPGAGHFVHRDATDKVTKYMTRWLAD